MFIKQGPLIRSSGRIDGGCLKDPLLKAAGRACMSRCTLMILAFLSSQGAGPLILLPDHLPR